MKAWKIALRFSLLANIALALWALSEQEKRQTLENGIKKATAMVEHLDVGLDRIERDIKDETLRIIASTDQLDSFIEEHRNYAR